MWAWFTKTTRKRWPETGRIVRKPIGQTISPNLWMLCKIMTGLGVNLCVFVRVCTCSRGVLRASALQCGNWVYWLSCSSLPTCIFTKLCTLTHLCALLPACTSWFQSSPGASAPAGYLRTELGCSGAYPVNYLWVQMLIDVFFSMCSLETMNNKWIDFF